MINHHQSSFSKKSGTVEFNQSRQCERASLHENVQPLHQREHKLIVGGAGFSDTRRCLRLQRMVSAGKKEITYEHKLREAVILDEDVEASAHIMRCCWAFSNRRSRLNTVDTEVTQYSILIEMNGLMHDCLLIIK